MASSDDSGSFDRFLQWLSPDREEAAIRYDEIRKKLNRYFILKNVCDIDRDPLFDLTIERVLKIEDRWPLYQSPVALCIGVSKNVLREYRKKRPSEDIKDFDIPSPPGPDPDHEKKLTCLESCVAKLPEISRDLIMRLYRVEKQNKAAIMSQLAAEHGGISNLRVKAFRIRAQLRPCIAACMGQASVN